MSYIRLDIVNKKEYENHNRDYREIKISIPKDSEQLEKDFDYLGLDYKYLDIQDTHIKECSVIFEDDPDFSINITGILNNMMIRESNLGNTTPFTDMKELYNVIKDLNPTERNKLLALFKAEENKIKSIKDVIKYIKNLDKFYLDENSFSYEQFAENEIDLGEVYMDDVLPYIDLETLGKDLIEDRNAILTDYGVLCRMDEGMEQENEEEME